MKAVIGAIVSVLLNAIIELIMRYIDKIHKHNEIENKIDKAVENKDTSSLEHMLNSGM